MDDRYNSEGVRLEAGSFCIGAAGLQTFWWESRMRLDNNKCQSKSRVLRRLADGIWMKQEATYGYLKTMESCKDRN